MKSLSHVQLFVTPWTVAYHAPPSMGYSRQEYWSGLPFPSPGDLPDPGIEPRSPALQADALPSELPGKPHIIYIYNIHFQIFSLKRYYKILCYIVGPCWLSILYIGTHLCSSQTPIYPPFPLVTISLFSKFVSLLLFYK